MIYKGTNDDGDVIIMSNLCVPTLLKKNTPNKQTQN